jgi:hypothetical protein
VLSRHLAKGRRTVVCDDSSEDVDIVSLVTDVFTPPAFSDPRVQPGGVLYQIYGDYYDRSQQTGVDLIAAQAGEGAQNVAGGRDMCTSA